MSSRSYYHEKMIEYRNAKNTLNDKLEFINNKLRECDDSFSDFPKVYNNNVNVEGQVVDNFNNKSEKFSNELNNILDGAKESRDVIEQKIDLAQERYLHYKELYERACHHHDD